MAHVSLIVPAVRENSPAASEIDAARDALETAGHEVEVVVAVAPEANGDPSLEVRPDRIANDGQSWTWVASAERGRAAAAITGLRLARGEVLLVLDPDGGYAPIELVRVVDALDPSRDEMAVASRLVHTPDASLSARPKRLLGKLFQLASGSSDPLSGLVGLTRPALDLADDDFRAVGSQFALELLTKVKGRRIDVPARPRPSTRRRGRPGFDDIRHLKHLADHRFGNVSRLLQFCIVGASGMVVDLTFYALFQVLFFRVPWLASHPVPPTQVPFALAIARGLAICVALVWNFSLNRRLTFSYARGGSKLRQFVAYVLSNLLGVTVSMLLSLGLPSWVTFFHDHKLVAAVVGIVTATGISFSMSRWLVFRKTATTPVPDDPSPFQASPARRSDGALAEPTAAR